LCDGFLPGRPRYLYAGTYPEGVEDKLKALQQLADRHQVDLRTAALQINADAADVYSETPGAHTVEQVPENARSFGDKLPAEFWEDLKRERMIAPTAPVPS